MTNAEEFLRARWAARHEATNSIDDMQSARPPRVTGTRLPETSTARAHARAVDIILGVRNDLVR
jgi:hypothetical protein